ncbi:MAG: class I/II aminotransferase [Candidatus Peregrinibacteria bacterium GW2011_GWF2_33_10]|nr:MAG: class I/II aminotransferase [Candidatus Peregrinibacteria bacterium GW2011_GWF2_33_10]OGJ44437.1 MAG: hypothetical protein A2263_02010 [Candidatus Peregrinibacteria bacterium RIFOXYA2_FULL_33_21]OGJ50136.1 MAG: hypothetical protein A2307_04335 [Candidatus Peregrinibacteria bacterium RIFOXYB2_FULL_33_20]
MSRSALEKVGKKFRQQGISKRVQNIVTSPIKEMMILASKYDNVISLGQGVPSYDTPEHIKKAAIEAIQGKEAAKYSLLPGRIPLRKAIAENLYKKYNVNYDPIEEIMVSVGGMEAIACAIMTVVEQNDEVIVFEPTFASHIEQILLAGGKIKSLKLYEEDGWQPRIEDLKKLITKKTKMILVCNPVNPTGTVFKKEILDEIAKSALENNLFILTDETYDFLVYDKKSFESFIKYSEKLPELRKNLICTYSFSKNYAMTGYRVGYVCAEADVINHLSKVHDAFTICAPVVSQIAAETALKGPQGFVNDLIGNLENKRNLVCKRLDKLNKYFSYVKPEGAYYVFPKILKKGVDSFEFALKLLDLTQVVVVPGRAFGEIGEGHIRMAFGAEESKLNEAFDRIEKKIDTIF